MCRVDSGEETAALLEDGEPPCGAPPLATEAHAAAAATAWPSPWADAPLQPADADAVCSRSSEVDDTSWGAEIRATVVVPPPHRPGEPPLSWVATLHTLWAYSGPGLLIGVGFVDPGNVRDNKFFTIWNIPLSIALQWSTDLSGGALFNYDLLFVVWVANLVGCLLQALAVRLGVASGLDLAACCRRAYPPNAAKCLWVIAEGALVSTDVAEARANTRLVFPRGFHLFLTFP